MAQWITTGSGCFGYFQADQGRTLEILSVPLVTSQGADCFRTKVSQLKVQCITFSCFGGRGGLELTDWLETDFSFSRTLYQSLFFLSLAPSNEERS